MLRFIYDTFISQKRSNNVHVSTNSWWHGCWHVVYGPILTSEFVAREMRIRIKYRYTVLAILARTVGITVGQKCLQTVWFTFHMLQVDLYNLSSFRGQNLTIVSGPMWCKKTEYQEEINIPWIGDHFLATVLILDFEPRPMDTPLGYPGPGLMAPRIQALLELALSKFTELKNALWQQTCCNLQ